MLRGADPWPMTPHRCVPFDFPGLSVGVADYEEGPTGCTVIALDRLATVAIDARGGIPAVFRPEARYTEAICLAGGSVLGLAAATGSPRSSTRVAAATPGCCRR